MIGSGGKQDPEVIAYCYSAVLSMVPLAVIQNQQEQVFATVLKMVSSQSSDATTKYGIVSLQFLLHSKTEQDWSLTSTCAQTKSALKLLMAALIDAHKDLASKQAVKSVCLLL